jgi:hypothetical protein
MKKPSYITICKQWNKQLEHKELKTDQSFKNMIKIEKEVIILQKRMLRKWALISLEEVLQNLKTHKRKKKLQKIMTRI